ncbi:SDR family oxidoreductase [Halomonas icarae]|uniref:SDR family NAD(P)-dependent oxidoreductase n=1 Tax=Halomonas icarae TaxID=2691040 RepID=A0A7X4W0K0_9GAMM|nr:SDR family oxidoreductase [Halomonas icarae]MDR5903551.1 SDR family oxidoreductase [Halomonas icarae]NAW12853.1 SDR family NAD(P)-dependent oxidoreductase [Halomonas icarae]
MDTALVTGATSGVGRAIALRLAQEGYNVLAMGRNAAALDELSRTPGVTPICVELTDREAVCEALDNNPVDVLVNNAGIMPPLSAFQDSEQADIDAAIAVNFSAQVALTRLVVPVMCQRGRGHMFFTGSTAGHAPFPNMAVYCATKAAIGGFAQALRLDVANSGVRVTEIVAGRIETNLYHDILSAEKRAAMYAGQTAVQPEDVAEMLSTVLAMPASVDVSRFDIVPARKAESANKQK